MTMKADDWQLIYCAAQLYQAELISNALNENDIECVIMNKQDSVYHFGDIEIYVPTANAFLAKQLILEIEGE